MFNKTQYFIIGVLTFFLTSEIDKILLIEGYFEISGYVILTMALFYFFDDYCAYKKSKHKEKKDE